MKRQYRTLIVMVVAVGTAALASFAVYRAVQRMPVREVEVASMHVVVAAEALPVGTRLTEKHLKIAAWPSRNPVAGSFAACHVAHVASVRCDHIGESVDVTYVW